jgi:hypothetical protein
MKFKFSTSFNLWFYFFIFLIVDSYLSYVPASNTEKWLVFLAGILTPLSLIIFSKPPIKKENIFQKEQFEKSTYGVWIVLGFLLAGLRFWKLTTLFAWPTGDEATIGMLAIGLIRHWNWHFFHGFAQLPFSFHWICAFFYQITQSSKLALWFLSAVISAALIPLTYFGARRFCGKSFSFILMGLMATGFWPMYLGRYGFLIFLLLWELVVFYFLLVFVEQSKKKSNLVTAGLLGLVTGLGCLTITSWMIIGFVVILAVIWISFRDKIFLPVAIFLILMAASLSPFFTAAWLEGYGQHIRAVGFWNAGFDWEKQATIFGDYWMLLWGSVNQSVAYGSIWGGFLNPILAALFFLGLIEIYFRFSKFYLFLFLSVLTACLSSGFLSWSLETYRILTILPFLFLAVALGLHGLLRSVPRSKAVWIALLLLCSSFALDFYRLIIPYSSPDVRPAFFENTGRSYEKYYAGRMLESLHSQYGPGLIYTDWVPDAADESLAFVTYPYNCAWNSTLSQVPPRWAAVFTSGHFQPFLQKRFPQSRWEVIPTADPGHYSSHVLGIIPVTTETAPVFRSWYETYFFWMGINLQLLDKPNGKSGQTILEEMIKFYPRVPHDPFLQSVYLEKFINAYSRERVFYPGHLEFNYNSYVNLLDSSLKNVYPDTWIYTYVGRLLMEEKQLAKARIALNAALRLDPKNGLALGLLKTLDKSAPMVREK